MLNKICALVKQDEITRAKLKGSLHIPHRQLRKDDFETGTVIWRRDAVTFGAI